MYGVCYCIVITVVLLCRVTVLLSIGVQRQGILP